MEHQSFIELWDSHITDWLAGGESVPAELMRWRELYQPPNAKYAPVFNAVPEPWVGDIANTPPAVVLGLNPGHPETAPANDWHSSVGAIAQEIRLAGSYSRWTAAGPFWQPQWQARKQPYWNARRKFLEGWLGHPLGPGGVVGFELYPWHSVKWATSAMRIDAALLDAFVFEPAASSGAGLCFAFGADWFHVVRLLDMQVVCVLSGARGDWQDATPSRRVLVARHRALDLTIVAMKHSGGAGPPKPSERESIKAALEGVL